MSIASSETQQSTLSAITVREAVLADYPQLATVQVRNGLECRPREEWEHLWLNNPAYYKKPNFPIGWVAENADQQIVGYIGNIPLSFEFRGQELIAAVVCGLSMDEAYRGTGGLLLRRLLNQKTPDFILTTTANAVSARLAGKTFKAPRVPTGDWGCAVFWITGYRGFLASVVKTKGWPRLLTYPAAGIMSVRDRLTKNSWRSRKHREVEVCSAFDERFDVFWDELKRAYPDRMLATRSRESLQWHFKYPLAQKRVWIVTVTEGSRLLAYSIFFRQDNAQIGLKRVRLADFQTLDHNHDLLVPMLAWGLRRCEEEGIHMLEAFGFRPEKQQVIDTLAPYRRQMPSWWYFYKPVNKDVEPMLRDPNLWDPSHYDGDGSL
jgi:hypothetical protein